MLKQGGKLKNQKSVWDEFTSKYALSKTLRFSLIPVLTEQQENKIIGEKGYSSKEQIRRQDRVEKFFNDNKENIFEVDIERKKRYKALKYYLTELHKLFVKESLEKVKTDETIDFSELFKYYKQFETCKDDEQQKQLSKSINEEKVKLAKYFGNKEGKGGVFQCIAEKYYDWLREHLEDEEKISDDSDKKQRKNNILLSKNVLLVLRKKIKNGEIQERKEDGYELNEVKYLKKEKLIEGTLVEYFEGWSTYFKNFNEIRGNLYKDYGRKEDIEESEGKIKIKKANAGQLTTRILDENFEIFIRNVVWAEKNKKTLRLSNFQDKDIVSGISVFDSKFYIHCLLQTDINVYNKIIAELNTFFNEKKGKNKIDYLKNLHKQLLLTDGLEDKFVEEILDDDELIKKLEEFKTHAKEKITSISGFLKDGDIDGYLADIQLNENQLHYFCNKYFGSWSYLRDLYYEQNDVADKNKSKDKKSEFKDKEGIVKSDISLDEIKELLINESKEDFIEAVKRGWFCFDFETQKADLKPLIEVGVYNESVSNFENFTSFLKFEINSLLYGRTILSRKEIGNQNRIADVKSSLKAKKNNGERVDDLLVAKFSEEGFVKNIKEGAEEKQKNFEQAFKQLKEAVASNKKLARDKDFECKRLINEYCVRVSDINIFFALFTVPEGVDGNHINNTVRKFKENNTIVPFFNVIRNFMTKRADEVEKIKLNFDINNLLGGWGYKTEEHPRSTDYRCRLYSKDKTIYLGIVGDEDHSFLDKKFQLMDYYQLDGKGIFNVYRGKFDKKYKEEDRLKLSNEVLLNNIEKIIDENLLTIFPKAQDYLKDIKNKLANGVYNFIITRDYIDDQFKIKTNTEYDKYKKRDKDKIIIDILKKDFGNIFNFSSEEVYLFNRIKELFGKTPKRNDFIGVDKMVYELTKLEPFFYKTNFNSIKLNSNDTKIKALFQIYCKDFSQTRDKDSTKNLHTLYFEELFSEDNKENPIFKLSGGAEMFFREKIDDYKIEQWERKDLRKPKTDKFPNKKRRFTENQILFHVPIVLNNINDGGNINREIHKYIQKNEDVKILGIDRGEKELAYYCLLDKDGKICEGPKTLNITGSNIMNGTKQSVNYRNKLDIREKERMMARRSWTKIEDIKDLKSGYISNIVNDIARLAVDNKSMVCLEELNHGFKKDRSIRIEKGVYQRLENALVDKLNYLVLKKTPEGVRNALQLTPENRALKYWGNQMGAIFYTDAKFTSKTCPHCGFRRRGVESMKTAEIVKEKIKEGQLNVFFEKDKDRFRIEYGWKVKDFDFGCEDLYGKSQLEVIYSDVERNSWNNDDLKEIFRDCLQNGVELFSLVKNNSNFRYGDFGKVFNSLTWLRHSVEKNEVKLDRISCPKCHFSTMSSKVQKIKDGDANGAYNIARRGMMIFEKIRSQGLRKKIKTKKGIESKDLKVTLKEWDKETYRQWDKKDWLESKNERGL